MGIAKRREHRSRQPVVRTRLAGTPVTDNRIQHPYDDDPTQPDVATPLSDIVEVEVNPDGSQVTDLGNLGT